MHSATEGFGLVYRLYQIQSEILLELNEFLQSQAFKLAIAAKFEISLDDCIYDGGIQKYLDGYEISPHPDTKKKAATFMVNINPGHFSESQNFHNQYLRLRPEYDYVSSFWEANHEVDRCWIPWTWAEAKFHQRKNNSIVLFAPSAETIHAVKADYDHLVAQRTQLYGNLWFKESSAKSMPSWEQLDILNNNIKASSSFRSNIAAKLPLSLKRLLKGSVPDDLGDRNV